MPPVSTEEIESKAASEISVFVEQFIHDKSPSASEQLSRIGIAIDGLLSCLLRDNGRPRSNDGVIVRKAESLGPNHLRVEGECWHIDQYKEPILAEFLVDPTSGTLAAYKIRVIDRDAEYGKNGKSYNFDKHLMPKRDNSWEWAFDKNVGRLHNN